MLSRIFPSKPVARVPVAVPPGMRIYAIGDIHGRLDLLDALHLRIQQHQTAYPAREPLLIYLGDYVDRGTNAAGVLDRLSLHPLPGFARILLRGNHEEMLSRFLSDAGAGPSWRQLGGMETLLSYRVDVARTFAEKGHDGLSAALNACFPPHHMALLVGLETSATFGGYFFCHAGVRPGVPLERQSREDLMWIRHEFLDSTADFGRIVVHGHTPVEKPDIRANRINIDTGAYATGRLTCLVLEGEQRGILAT